MYKDRHNRKLNLMKAIKSIRVGDFDDANMLVKLHEMYLELHQEPMIRNGEDQWGLTPDEVHSLSINNTIQVIKSVRERSENQEGPSMGLAGAKNLVEKHPAYQQAKVIRELERENQF